MNTDVLYGIFWCAVIGGALGSKILYYTVNIKDVIADPSIILNFQNGWVVYGGIIGGVLASFLYCKIKKVDFVAYLDLVLPAVAFAQGCGRIGCFFAGCCYGRETTSPLGITYWQSDFAPNGVKLVPTQIYSGIGDFAMAFLLMAYAKKEPAFLPKDKNAHSRKIAILSCVAKLLYHAFWKIAIAYEIRQI